MHPTTPSTPVPRDVWRIASLVFLQMLPATLLTPAIRPLFAEQHGGNEHAMHAFMALNMLGAALVVPWVGRWAERLSATRGLTIALLLVDACALCALAAPLSTPTVLCLRALEGAAHVSVTSLLLAEAAALGRAAGSGRAMGLAGAALMFAVALGSALGGQLVAQHARLPFYVGAALQLGLCVAVLASRRVLDGVRTAAPVASRSRWRDIRALSIPLLAVFIGRFTVGCLVVTFSLFVHRAHGGSDRSVGLLLSLITLPFALAMYPITSLSDRISRATLMLLGGVGYALSLAALPWVPFALLPWTMIAAGVTSACLFAPSLCYAATLGAERKQAAMALLNTAGCVGMLLGPAFAGVTSALLGSVDPVRGYRWVFGLAAASVVLWVAGSFGWLTQQARDEAVARAKPARSLNT